MTSTLKRLFSHQKVNKNQASAKISLVNIQVSCSANTSPLCKYDYNPETGWVELMYESCSNMILIGSYHIDARTEFRVYKNKRGFNNQDNEYTIMSPLDVAKICENIPADVEIVGEDDLSQKPCRPDYVNVYFPQKNIDKLVNKLKNMQKNYDRQNKDNLADIMLKDQMDEIRESLNVYYQKSN